MRCLRIMFARQPVQGVLAILPGTLFLPDTLLGYAKGQGLYSLKPAWGIHSYPKGV